MRIPNPDLDLDLPTDIPDLPPPWPPTEVAIRWWENRVAMYPTSAGTEERLLQARRDHHDEPFVWKG